MEDISRSWGWAVLFGLLTLAVGILVMVWPGETLKVLALLFGLQLLVTGIYRVVRSFAVGEKHRLLSVILGVVAITVAVIALRNVTGTVAVLAIIMGLFWIVNDIVEFVMAVGDSDYPQRGFSIFMSLVSVAAGIVIVAWPVESVSVLAWLMGVWLVVLGVLGVVFCFMLARDSGDKPAKAATA